MEEKMVYVVSPAFFKTGGTELAHQLVWLYNRNGICAKIAYFETKKYEEPLNHAFRQYVQEWCAFESIKDEENNIIIFPEIYTELVLNFKNAHTIIWWMSVDNYLDKVSFLALKKRMGILRAIKHSVLDGALKGKKLKEKGVYHAELNLYQSEYAKQFLQAKHLTNIFPLSDYINDVFFQNRTQSARQDIVLFNPRKGYRFTKKIIKKSPQFHWVALEKLSTEEVMDLLRRSKVYIDFGNHPGKDRFPREAAISGCCIITGRRGSAGNSIDIAIDEKYKFKDVIKNIPLIIELISRCLSDFDNVQKDFSDYRRKIASEKEIFFQEALSILQQFNK